MGDGALGDPGNRIRKSAFVVMRSWGARGAPEEGYAQPKKSQACIHAFVLFPPRIASR